MSALSVGTTAAALPDKWLDVQNLGTVDVFLDYTSGVSSTSGIRLSPGQTYSRPAGLGFVLGARLYAVSSATVDCRVTVIP